MPSTSSQTVWITGASSGIGEAVARVSAERGDRVIISARREHRLRELEQELNASTSITVVPFDMTDIDNHRDVVDHVWGTVGPVDLMVHNAGISQRGRVDETDLSVDRRVMEVNFFGTISLTKALLPRMQARGTGHFTVVSSVAGYVGTDLRSAYAASKHALHGYFNSLRAEVFEQGIGVTMVCPGYVDTEITLHALTSDGSPMGELADKQQQGVSAERVATRLLDASAKGKPEVYVGGKELAAIFLQRLSPSLIARFIRNVETT